MKEGKIPYGYRMIDGRMAVDDAEGRIVQEIFLKYCEGMPQYKLFEYIHEFAGEQGYGDIALKKQTVSVMLKNEKYLGDIMYPPLITAEMFERVQIIRQERNRERGRSKEFQDLKEQHIFYKKLYCGLCGSEFRLYRRKIGRNRKIMVWDCRRHIVESRISCRNICITEEEVERSFLRIINRLQREPKNVERNISDMAPKETSRFKAVDREIKNLEKNEISHSAEEWKKLIFKRAAIMYGEIKPNDSRYYTMKLKNLLSDLKPQTQFDNTLFKETVKKVIIHPEYGVKFILINGLELTGDMFKK